MRAKYQIFDKADVIKHTYFVTFSWARKVQNIRLKESDREEWQSKRKKSTRNSLEEDWKQKIIFLLYQAYIDSQNDQSWFKNKNTMMSFLHYKNMWITMLPCRILQILII